MFTTRACSQRCSTLSLRSVVPVAAGAPTQTPREAARRQGLRLRPLPRGLAPAGHCPAHRSARAPLKRTLGTPPVGSRKDTGVAEPLQEAEGALREAGRRAPGFPKLGLR